MVLEESKVEVLMNKPKPVPKKFEEEAEDPCVIHESDKADSIDFFNLKSVHMRAFHLAWFSFFIAFMAWFSVAPLMPVIKKSLHLTKMQVSYANLASVSTTILARIVLGPLVDRYGPKTTMALVLGLGAIPVFFVGSVQTWQQLVAVRAAIGFLGGSFVMSQAWTSNMFRQRIVGTANAVVGGWGNLGGGVIQPVMVSIMASMMAAGATKQEAWRHSFFVPAALLLGTAFLVYFLGKDTPKGDMSEIKKAAASAGPVKSASSTFKDSFGEALSQPATFVLALQYAASFGVEITAFNMVAMYYTDVFNISDVKAGQVALLAGITNIFARAMGGYMSDVAFCRLGMRGRLWVQFVLVLLEGLFLLWFSHAKTFTSATILLVTFSIFVQAANGSCYAIVPFVSRYKGSVSGLVGAGGNLGAMCFALLFLFGKFETVVQGYQIMGGCVLVAACTMGFIRPGDLKEFNRLETEMTLHERYDDDEESEESNDIEMPAAKNTRPYSPPMVVVDTN